jgi:hypothetical protein
MFSMANKPEDVITLKIHGTPEARQKLVDAVLAYMAALGDEIQKYGPSAGFTLTSSCPPSEAKS